LSNLATTFARAERAAVISILRAKPDVSLTDLRLLCRRGRFGRILGTLTLREYWSGTPDDTIDPITGAPDKLARRQRYDDEVIAALRDAGCPLSHDEVATRVGSSAHEARYCAVFMAVMAC
jgi:voltage-gated potassium channel Kch